MEPQQATSPSNVKSAVNFFNSLNRNHPTPSKTISITKKNNKTTPEKSRHITNIEILDQLTPDLEAKRIIEDFSKQVSPYNTFKLPLDAIDSDFFKETVHQFLPDVISNQKKKIKRTGSYGKPTELRYFSRKREIYKIFVLFASKFKEQFIFYPEPVGRVLLQGLRL